MFLDFFKGIRHSWPWYITQETRKIWHSTCGLGVVYKLFSNTLQHVTYNGAKSKRQIMKCGVPQGSILGPLPFLLHINELPTVSNDCLSVLFAGDTNMFVTGKNTAHMWVTLNTDLQEICEWLRCHKLSLTILKPIVCFSHHKTRLLTMYMILAFLVCILMPSWHGKDILNIHAVSYQNVLVFS